jgi:hypothetical protein
MRMHPFQSVRAAVFAWACAWAVSQYLPLFITFDQHLFETGLNRWIYTHGYGLPTWSREFPALAVWKGLAFSVGGYVAAKTHLRSHVVIFAIVVLLANAVAFAGQLRIPHHYPLAQLIVDLLVLYPCAAFLGGIAADRERQVSGVSPC